MGQSQTIAGCDFRARWNRLKLLQVSNHRPNLPSVSFQSGMPSNSPSTSSQPSQILMYRQHHLNHSDFPSQVPSNLPTISPFPSPAPSESPSRKPSIHPSYRPSSIPSSSPTLTPTTESRLIRRAIQGLEAPFENLINNHTLQYWGYDSHNNNWGTVVYNSTAIFRDTGRNPSPFWRQ
jgi:hypothetical protein